MTLRCLWIRRWIGPYVDRSLPEGRARGVAHHLDCCAHCRHLALRRTRLTALVRGVAVETTEPPWTDFWPAVRARIVSEGRLVGRPPWRARPAWHLAWLPRLAVGSAIAGTLLLSLLLWTSDERLEPSMPGIVVRALEMSHPDTNVMVFSTQEHEMTVIWVFGLDPSPDQTLRKPEEVKDGWFAQSLSLPSWS